MRPSLMLTCVLFVATTSCAPLILRRAVLEGTAEPSTTSNAPKPPAAQPSSGGASIEVPHIEISDDVRRVKVFTEKHIDRACEVVGVLDFHSKEESEDKGFDLLRLRAAALGADAVIGAEFEHGENGEPSHLSGMAVRFIGP